MPVELLDILHYSDNDSDTYCFLNLDERETLYTDDPRMDGINCPRCLSEMEADEIGIARQIAKLKRVEFQR